MFAAYAVVVAAARTFSMRAIAIVVVALHVILLLSPPLQLTDVFNYLGYARLGALHHLNPYTHVIKQEMFDPVYRFTSWHNLRSPYGPLFTAITYPLAFVSLPVAYWMLKIVTVAAQPRLPRACLAAARGSWAATRASSSPSSPSTRSSCIYAVARLPQRLLHARARRWARSRCCSPGATGRPERR